jgi:hypothetical protein
METQQLATNSGKGHAEALAAATSPDQAHNVVRLSQVTKIFRMGDNEV